MSPAVPRLAASLILLRDTVDGPQALIGQRHARTPAFPGVLVFPGGKVEPGDAEAEARAGFRQDGWAAPAGAAYAALRETFEETGVWLAEDGTRASFPEAPGLSRLSLYAHWVTPERNPYRFDTWFFLALATETEARASLSGDEFASLAWERPAHVLRDHADALMTPTHHSLARLAGAGSLAEILQDARVAGLFEAQRPGAHWREGRSVPLLPPAAP